MRVLALLVLGTVLLLGSAQWPFFDDANDANDAPVPPPNQDPVASFSQTPVWGVSPLEVVLDASASTDPDGWIVSYVWDFGDGTSAVGRSATNTYTTSTSHTFTAWLTVTDNAGGTDSTTRFIMVSDTAP